MLWIMMLLQHLQLMVIVLFVIFLGVLKAESKDLEAGSHTAAGKNTFL